MKKHRISGFLTAAPILAAYAGLLLAPAAAAGGVRHGLEVCGRVLLPSLFPFLVLSGLLNAAALPEALARAAGPVVARCFGVPGSAAAPLLLGLTGGYPVGAAATAELVRRGTLTAREGERVLAVSNNTGPAFLVGAAGGVFGSARAGLLLYLCHVLAAVGVGVLLGRGQRGAAPSPAPPRRRADIAPGRALTDSVRGAVSACLNICGFVLLFSAITALLEAAGLFSGAALGLSQLSGLALPAARALLTGILELGGGIAALQGLSPTASNLAVCAFLAGFGGLSVHCQTLAVLEGTELRCVRHFGAKLLHGVFSALLAAALGRLVI